MEKRQTKKQKSLSYDTKGTKVMTELSEGSIGCGKTTVTVFKRSK
jgi:RecG-like helicase